MLQLRDFEYIKYIKYLKHIKRMDINCHIPDLVLAFSYAENGGMNLLS